MFGFVAARLCSRCNTETEVGRPTLHLVVVHDGDRVNTKSRTDLTNDAKEDNDFLVLVKNLGKK